MHRAHLLALLSFASFAVVSGCSSDEDISTGTDLLSQKWTLPSEVRATGARVRVTYDGAPRWTGTSACAKSLRDGTRSIGEYLQDKFEAVSSVGGYACRRNTADTKMMSVHGTGRALDVFIPKVGSSANSIRGDEIANWLVMHASRMGIQLIIWNRSIWRANGTNESGYGGPHPHDDHLHVEITNEAARMETPWFTDPDDGVPVPVADAGVRDASVDARTDASTWDASTDDYPPEEEEDAAVPPPKDAGSPPPKDAGGGTTAPSDDGVEQEGPAEGHEWEVPEGEPGETDSLGDKSKSKSRSRSTNPNDFASSGCSISMRPHTDASVWGGAAIACLLVMRGRERRKQRGEKISTR